MSAFVLGKSARSSSKAVYLILLMFAALAAFSLAGAQQAFAANDMTAGGIESSPQAATSVDPQSYEYPYKDPNDSDIYISMNGRVSGTIIYDVTTKTLTIENVKSDEGYLNICILLHTVTLKLVGDNVIDEIYTFNPLIITGSGSLTGKIVGSTLKSAGITVKSGTIKGNITSGADFAMSGGTVKGNVWAYNGAAKMSGGTIAGSLSTDKKLTMTKGTIKYVSGDSSVVSCYGLDMKGGTISATNAKYGVSVRGSEGVAGNLKMTGGKIAIAGTSYTGLSISGGNLVMSGGTLAVTGSHQDAISVSYNRYRSKNYGGKVQIKGGAFKATVKTPKSYYAVYATSMTNKLTATKAIVGRLSPGAQFKVGGNLYKVMKYSAAKLAKYGSSKTSATINKVTYGKHAYDVEGIAAGAFNSKAGQKVKSIVVASLVSEIGAKAFYNTKSLTSLRFNYTGWIKRVYDSNYNLKSLKVNSGYTVSAKAFTKCGKNGGKGLTVSLGKNGIWSKEAGIYKTFLAGRGLSRSAKLKSY